MPWWRNLFDNTLTVQFEHRMTAYALLALAVLHAIDAIALARRDGRDPWRLVAGRGDRFCRRCSASSRCCYQVPIDLALAHQAMAIVVLTLAILQTERLVARRVGAGRASSWFVPVGQPG